jgi:hypothetical protein
MSATAPTGINNHRLQAARDVLHEREIDKARNWQLKDFTLFSTNLRHCLPEVPAGRYWKYYLNLLCYRDLLLKEHDNCESIDSVFGLEESSSEGYTGPLPAIFTSFHFGSYRSIVGILAQQRVDFVMVVNKKIFDEEQDEIRETVRLVQTVLKTNVFFDVVNAEDPRAVMKINSYLARNISLAIFADGNTGVGGEYRKDNKMARIDFLGQPIFVRRGAAVLAKITRKPIVPLFVYYPESESLTPAVVFHDPISCEGKEAPDGAIKKLYAVLEGYVRKYPDQWQTWFYFHKFLDIETIRGELKQPSPSETDCMASEVEFNEDKYALFKMDANGFLFDKKTYKTYPVEPALFNHLAKIKKGERRTIGINEVVGQELGQSLLSMQILTPAS